MPGFDIPNPYGPAHVAPMVFSSVRTSVAVMRGVENKLLFRTWGGLGDQICAEPTLRFAIEAFKGCEIYLASEHPELFQHLPFKKVFNLLKEPHPNYLDYLCFDTIVNADHIVWEFVSHMTTNCVDFPSICAFRSQIPIKDKWVKLEPNVDQRMEAVKALGMHTGPRIAIHAGKHWQSKTFPKSWWDGVIDHLTSKGVTPILIGADADDNRTTVDVATQGCLDLRNKLSIMGSVALLHLCDVLLTNDSSPLHMAASNADTWIGFIATCKHPDYISHWRNGRWSYRMKNLGRGGIWDVLDFCPNKENKIDVDNVDADMLLSWLPSPVEFAQWALDRVR